MVNPIFESLLSENGRKFTIILGSGFHMQALGVNSILSSWEKLLKQQDTTIELTDSYTLDFEQLIIRRAQNQGQNSSKDKASSQIEDLISKEICFDLKCSQQKALKFDKEKYPSGIFNSEYISDIISLNFDTLALELCSEKAGVDITLIKPMQFSYEGKIVKDVFYYEVKFPKSRSIRFWFPHGSIIDDSIITLGTRKYAMRLATIEKLRKYSKFEEKAGSNYTGDTSWYHQLTHNPVIILGANLSTSEWDIWFALVNRERNFSKDSKMGYKHPIFQMRECECKNDVQHAWFQPLFTGMKFDQQWSGLEKMLNKERRKKN
jgi:hypothetical protein